MDERLLAVALGREEADLVVRGDRLINVNTGEIYPGGVAVAGERIAAIGDVAYTVGDGTEVVEAGDAYIVPGFVDGHIHPESSSLSMTRFAGVVLARGTTSVFTDLHEIAVVGGMEAVDAALEEARTTPLKLFFVVPSHVPFAPGLETSGGRFDPGIIASALERAESVGLSEVVSLYVAAGDEELLRSVDDAHRARKALVGHGPDTKGPAWSAFAAAGITNDHESLDVEDVLLRVRNGVHAHLRHNLIVPTLPELVRAATERGVDTRFLSLVTDDTSAIALVQDGHLDHLVRLALAEGVGFVTAVQMVTLNPASSFHLEGEIGTLAPGRYADINVVSGPEDFRVLKTIARGRPVAEDGGLLEPLDVPERPQISAGTFHLREPVAAQDLVITAKTGSGEADVRFMRTLPWVPITEGDEATLPVVDGRVAADTDRDILHVAVIERHHETGNVGKAFVGGFGLKRGAMASSVAHDNHNIVVMGADPDDMALAAGRVAELDGGVVLAENGRLVGEMALPLWGLLADADARMLAEERQTLLDKAGEMGCTVPEPFMFLSFITLAGIPQFAVTDKGYVDCLRQAVVEPILGWK